MSDAIEAAILALSAARGPQKSFCPSEAARLLWPQSWQAQMGAVRAAALRLAAAGHIDILRKGRPVQGEAVRGVIRLRIRTR